MSEQRVTYGTWRGEAAYLRVTDDGTAYEYVYYGDRDYGSRREGAVAELTPTPAPLTIADYERAASRTANHNLSGERALIVAALGLTGEAGEVADLVKKHVGQGHPYDAAMRDRLIDEAGDIAWYLARLCEALMVPLDEVLARNIEKLAARYPHGFDPERSQHRAEGA